VGFDQVFDHGLTSKGSIGVVSSVFEVMTQVDLGFTTVSWSDLVDSVISVDDTN
jgi:hypothetical protein